MHKCMEIRQHAPGQPMNQVGNLEDREYTEYGDILIQL